MNPRKIFLGRNGQSLGPYSEEELRAFLAEGRVALTDLVWWGGQTSWSPISQLLTSLAPPASEPEPAAPEHDAEPRSPEVAYHHVSPLKFAILAVATLGIYEMFWFYKNWKYVRQRDESRILPFWRAVFAPLWCYSLARELSHHHAPLTATRAGFLAAAYVALVLASRLPDPWWLLTLGTFLPLLVFVSSIHAINSAAGVKSAYYSKFGAGPAAACFIGVPFLALAILPSLNVLPATHVVDGRNLPPRHRNYLRAEHIIEDSEQVQHFYSTGILSIKDDGNILTDQRIISYWRDPKSHDLVIESARYEDIEDVQLERGDTFTDSTMTIAQTDGSEFVLLLSIEAGGDQRCLETAQSFRQRKQPSQH